jgi:microcystin-dependent protein
MRPLLVSALAGAAFLGAWPVAAQVTGPAGGNQPFNNYQPAVAITQIVTTQGIFPCRDCPGATASNTIGTMRMFAGNFGVAGQPTANGQLIPISQNTALFSILGTQYGGDGKTTFALPDLGGRAIVGAGQGPGLSSWDVGQQGGEALTTLTAANLPPYAHGLPGGGATGVTGGSTPFGNLMPSTAMTYMIADDGAPFAGAGVTPILGQIQAFAGNFAPSGWLQANGQNLLISEHEALFNLIGTTYGGDGQTTFNLPDLQSRVAIGAGGGFQLGETGGDEETFLTLSQLPSHLHDLPGGGFTDLTGGNQPFSNMQPYLGLNYLIALQGLFPCRDAGPGCSMPDTEPFLGEIMLYAGGLIPNGWALANGQLLPINQNQALFALLGTNFGGDGRTTFALPDFRGRTALGTNDAFPVGTVVGQPFVTLTEAQMPEHVHALPGAAVPEPGTWALMIAGFGLAGAAFRRRRAVAA